MFAVRIESRLHTAKGLLLGKWLLAWALLASPAAADLVFHSVPVEVLAAGTICDRVPGEVLSAPGTTGGTIDHNFGGFSFVGRSDHVTIAPRVGVGLNVRLSDVQPGDAVTMRIYYPDNESSSWSATVTALNTLEFGSLPVPGKLIMAGTYRFWVLREGRSLFVYDFKVDGAENPGPCLSETS